MHGRLGFDMAPAADWPCVYNGEQSASRSLETLLAVSSSSTGLSFFIKIDQHHGMATWCNLLCLTHDTLKSLFCISATTRR